MSMTSLLNTKCSICGADLIFPAGINEVLCEFCLRPNARPKSRPSETTLMKYANERRNLGDFDKAAEGYRQVLQKNMEEHEARWGLLLCKYGVMYVEDSVSGKRMITCRKAVASAMQTEPDFLICCQQAEGEVREAYRRDAVYIDKVQSEIRRIRAREEPYDVFICYKESDPDGARTRDSVLAQQICMRMRDRGYRVFYAPDSLKQKSGANYEAAIFAALSDARVMLALGTSREYFESIWVRSEWQRYLEMIEAGEEKLLVPMYLDMDPGTDLPAEFRARFLQGINMADVGFLYDLEILLQKVVRKRPAPTGSGEKFVFDRRELIRAMFLVEDGLFDKAAEALEAIISAVPDCAEAHLGLCLAQAGLCREEDLPGLADPLKENNEFRRAMRYASEDGKARLERYVEQQAERLEREAREAEERRTREKAEREARAEEERRAREEAERKAREAAERLAREAEAAAQRLAREARQAADHLVRQAEGRDKAGEAFGGEDASLIREGLAQLRKDALKGDTKAQFAMGALCDRGIAVETDKKQAIGWYRKAAKLGHTQAQNRLGEMYRDGDGIPANRTEALQLFYQAAGEGDGSACYNLAEMYDRGDGVERSPQKALSLYRKAANQGVAQAQYRLACMTQAGEGVPVNPAEAARLFAGAAQQGHAEAQLRLAKLLADGKGVERDLLQAAKLYALAADQGLTEALYALACMEYAGEGMKIDLEGAARHFLQAASQGHLQAQYRLGCLFIEGEGVARDIEKALHWLNLASNQGSIEAKSRIGDLIQEGEVAGKKRYEAVIWYKTAVAYNYPPALYGLGKLYYNGVGVLKDRVGASRLYRNAAKQNYIPACMALADMLWTGDGIPKKKIEAVAWYRCAASLGDARAQYTMGCLYFSDEDVVMDIQEAVQWYRLAADQEWAQAQSELGKLYFNGEGVIAADREQGVYWLKRAVQNGSQEAMRFLELRYPGGLKRDERVGKEDGTAQSPSGEDPGRAEAVCSEGAQRPRMIRDDWQTIIRNIAQGQAEQVYAPGDCKMLSLGTLGEVTMQLAGFNLDDRVNGKGKAATTWIARELLPVVKPINPPLSVQRPLYRRGEGAIGGWKDCRMRQWLIEDVAGQLPAVVGEAVVGVLKRQLAYNINGYPMQQATQEKLWIPEMKEIVGQGARYASFCETVGLRSAGMAPENAPTKWWLRTAGNYSGFKAIDESGQVVEVPAETRLGVRLCFCLDSRKQ